MITRILAVAVAVAGIQGCGRSENSESVEPLAAEQLGGMAVRATCPPTRSFDLFFPLGTLDASEPAAGYFSVTSWLSKRLQEMGEAPLSCGEGNDSYRFIWLRSFHPTVVVRIDLTSDPKKATLHATELESDGVYAPGRVVRRAQRDLTKAELTKLRGDIRKEGLWSLPTNEDGPPGVDGSSWILEVRSEHRYHIIDRWSPRSGPMHTLGLEFLQLSGWRFDDVY
jgi:hypothetical protein